MTKEWILKQAKALLNTAEENLRDMWTEEDYSQEELESEDEDIRGLQTFIHSLEELSDEMSTMLVEKIMQPEG